MKPNSIRRALIASLVIWPLAFAPGLSVAQDSFPNKPVRLLVPFAPGGPIDALARALAAKLGESWKQQVIVDNRPGANEIVAAQALAKAPGDGYTLMLSGDATLSLNPQLYNKLPYDTAKEIAPIGRVAVSHMALVVPAGFPAKTFPEFVAMAKATPGKIAYGSAGPGNAMHLSMEWLSQQTSTQLIHVPYKGLAPVLVGMMGNEVQAAFGSVSVLVPYIEGGKLRALGMSGPKRATALPQVPTFAELGYPEFEASYYIAVSAPGTMPAALRSRIARDINAVTGVPAFQKANLDTFALDPVSETPEQFAAFLQKEKPIVERKVKLSGVKLD